MPGSPREGALPHPQTVGPFIVERELGHGATGTVLLGRDPADGRAVALKTMPLGREREGSEFAEVRARFLREAGTAARLQHPNIVTVYESGEDGGLAYIAMEVVGGHDLQRHTQASQLMPVPTLLRVMARVAEALAYAHRQGVVHRDIKPANVMVDPATDSVKVTDFGIARIADASRTRTGLLLGTPSYMSPEQLIGQRVDGRSDLYSLGVMLFELLCGQLPHKADSMAGLMRRIVNDRAPDIRGLRPEMPPELADLVARLLEKRPDARPADGQRLALELRQLAERIDAEAGPAGADAFEATVKFSRVDPGHNPHE